MTDSVISYGIVGVVSLLVFFSFAIGIEKMIKVILGNYILGSICLATMQSLDILIQFLSTTPSLKFLGFTYMDITHFLQQGKTSIVLVLYVIFLFLLYHKSKIRITLPSDEVLQKILYVFLVPLTVLSLVFTLEIALMGINSISFSALQTLATSLTTNVYLYRFISLTPVWILVHGIATVLITSELKISFKTDL